MPVRVLVEVSPEASEPALIEYCTDFLRERGYGIAPPNGEWETPRDFCRRVGIWGRQLRGAIDRFELRTGNKVKTERRGPSGRTTALLSNPAFDAFCRNI